MKEKTVFITGGTTGIGKAIAEIYLKRGATVGVCGRDEEKFKSSFSKSSPKLEFYKADVAIKEEIQSAVEVFSKKHGGLDLLIANAGVAMPVKSSMPDFSKGESLLKTNLFGVIYSFEAALKPMLKQKRGHIAVTGSLAGLVGLPATSFYSCSKAAVHAFCESMAIDLSSKGIHVTTLAPGYIDTPLTKKNKHPMPFLLSAEEAAKRMVKAIDHKKKLYIFPTPMRWLMHGLYHMPRGMYQSIMTSNLYKFKD